MRKFCIVAGVAVVGLLLWRACGTKSQIPDAKQRLRLATTTSVVDSGLLDTLVPDFERRTKRPVQIFAVGSGQALAMLKAGTADVAITHAPEAERQTVASGAASRRTEIMHNDFVIVGPKDGIAVVAGSGDFRDVLRNIAASGRGFVSRGDDSGTHRREQALFAAAGVLSTDSFVVSAKSGMAATLRRASKDRAYALTDRGTFLATRKNLDLVIVFQGDDELRNPYSVIEPASGDTDGARVFRDYLRTPNTRQLIGSFGVAQLGEPLFIPAE